MRGYIALHMPKGGCDYNHLAAGDAGLESEEMRAGIDLLRRNPGIEVVSFQITGERYTLLAFDPLPESFGGYPLDPSYCEPSADATPVLPIEPAIAA